MSPAKRKGTSGRTSASHRTPASPRTPASRRAPPRRTSSSPLSAERLARFDTRGMGDRVESLAAQLRAGAEIAHPAVERIRPHRPRRIVLFGMGGSAIAGDLVRSLVDREGSLPFHVVRHYEPPAWITPEDFLIFSSYSGETEETVATYRRLRELGAPGAAITTGGTLLELTRKDGIPAAILPSGHPPRAALGYAFSTLVQVVSHLGALLDGPERLERAADGVEEVASAYLRTVIQSRNPAKQLAIRLAGRAVVVVANERTLGPVAVRWKGQLNENAKHLAWAAPLPEMNHNEVDGYVEPRRVAQGLAAVLLRDPADHPRIQARFEWLEGYLGRKRIQVSTVEAQGDDAMTRLMTCTAMGDFVSYYLAVAHGTDPSDIPAISALKRALAG